MGIILKRQSDFQKRFAELHKNGNKNLKENDTTLRNISNVKAADKDCGGPSRKITKFPNN